uniref:Insulin-induced gene 1 protein n=2 Tax=Schistosoma japonicum TaxID=6182 RepID=C1LNC1_SCHJA|nr:Insulin-induced gene 1 protein [Schistosoma japonicum]CAX76199.1 Insulin-induced gene 1 protein [Schistosoma japonicum]CAX76200.1 Insulin-induced gene 1 protein [Schistosoma japonicum]CAX76201.1 Insulin-induced gene 1 protein [Schistosoma japonicum]
MVLLLQMTKHRVLFFRGLLLFFLGICFCWVSEALHNIKGEFTSSEISFYTKSAAKFWISFCCGVASATVGLLSPCIDSKIGAFHVYNKEWPSVLRCTALFFGFSHATARIDFATYSQLSLTAIGLSIALWWVFDRSLVGFVFGTAAALLATFIFQSCVWKQLYRFSHPMMAAWLPCLFFSGGVLIVLVGRQLAKPDVMALMQRKVK